MGESADGERLTLTPGETWTLRLPENATTGYRWTLESEGGPACALLSESRPGGDPAVPGQPGTRDWRFRAARTGGAEGRIALRSARPWETDASPARSFTLTVTVGG